ncbi:MAG: class I SAM-dependent methyltransferase [Myxococcales bacterium]|nr:class I SAM-dependent methyltransferase [Myxococcales bacterium]
MADADEIADAAARIRANPLLDCIYRDVYARMRAPIDDPEAYPRVLELGSGGGYFQSQCPRAITSECVPTPRVDRVVDGCDLEASFEAASLDAIVAFNVFHHLPDPGAFLRGASTVLRPGGKIVLVEPWFTPVGQWFYRGLHHEPYLLDPDDWSLRGMGRLAGANECLPKSVFVDSPARFAASFPALRVTEARPFHKGLYLVSGGLTFNTRVPRALAEGLVALDRRITRGDHTFGLFARIVVERVDPSAAADSPRTAS